MIISKLKIIVFILFILLSVSLVFITKALINKNQRITSLENNIQDGYEKHFEILNYYKAKNNQLVAQNNVLIFSKKELRNNISQSVSSNLNNLSVNPKKVEFYSETAFKGDLQIRTPLKDSICYDTVKCSLFRYRDEFYNVYGIMIHDSVKVNICSIDSVIQVVYKGSRYNRKGRKMPGIFFWIPRRIEQVISFKNPNCKAYYSKTILIK